MIKLNEKVEAAVRELNLRRETEIRPVEGWLIAETGPNDFSLERELKPLEGLWGGHEKYYHLRAAHKVEGGEDVYFRFDLNRASHPHGSRVQALAFVDGKPFQGIDGNHTEFKLGAGQHTIDIIAYSGTDNDSFTIPAYTYKSDTDTDTLYYDLKVPLGVAESLGADDYRAVKLLETLNAAVSLLELRGTGKEYRDSLKKAKEFLSKELLDKKIPSEAIETMIGHTHIDVAWLWPLRVSKDKAVRSFTTVLEYMDRYPEYVFMSSQPQLYKYVKNYCPEVYERIKKRVAEGRWEPEGAMWVEADCNLTSGESLVRQVVYGKRFFKEEFGCDSKLLWLPDVFGYSAALPQIMKKSGVDYFMTTKISWNDTNKMPCDTFMWRGIDGTELFTHFITTSRYEKEGQRSFFTTYNGDTDANSVMGCWQRYQHKDLNNEVLNCFGYGDGGGGPTSQMIENVRRLKNVTGCPKAEPGKAGDYFKRIYEKLKNNKRLPKWVGELYFEYHRGTYTTMARNKKYNRKSEFGAQDAELYSILAGELVNSGYPEEELREIWEVILLNQFHDILPGSSIKEVYDVSKEQYEYIGEKIKNIKSRAMKAIAACVPGGAETVVAFNPLGFNRTDTVTAELPAGFEDARVFDGETELPSQVTYDGKIVFVAAVPSKGYKAFTLKKTGLREEKGAGFETDTVRLKFDKNKNLVSVFDKLRGREVIKKGEAANRLTAYEDRPIVWDAWEVRDHYAEKSWQVDGFDGFEIIESGRVRKVIKITRRYGNSTIDQNVILYNHTARIDFETKIDWREKHTLLKTAFPVDVLTDTATFEIQFGNVKRPTHRNTSWQQAAFEVCAHKWADVSETGYGASLLNDCKYGYSALGSTLELSLLRGSTDPNPDADTENHSFTYSLYPHAGGPSEGGTVQEGYLINCPVEAYPAGEGNLPSEFSLLDCSEDNVIFETVKRAEDGNGIILRAYESAGKRVEAACTLYKEFGSVIECDLLENETASVNVKGNIFEFTLKPFEIKTFRLK